MRCPQPAVDVQTVTAVFYLVLALTCPSVAFGLIWWRRHKSPLRGSPRNWCLYATGLFAAVLKAPDSSFFVLYRVAGDWKTMCSVRFYCARCSGIVGVAAFALAFIQVRVRYHREMMLCDLLVLRERATSQFLALPILPRLSSKPLLKVSTQEEQTPDLLRAHELAMQLYASRPWTQNKTVFFSFGAVVLCFNLIMILDDFLFSDRSGCGEEASVDAFHCTDELYACCVRQDSTFSFVLAVVGLYGTLLYMAYLGVLSKREKLDDHFGIFLEFQYGSGVFLISLLTHTLLIVIPAFHISSWQWSVYEGITFAVLPSLFFCGWPVARTFRSVRALANDASGNGYAAITLDDVLRHPMGGVYFSVVHKDVKGMPSFLHDLELTAMRRVPAISSSGDDAVSAPRVCHRVAPLLACSHTAPLFVNRSSTRRA